MRFNFNSILLIIIGLILIGIGFGVILKRDPTGAKDVCFGLAFISIGVLTLNR